MKKFEKLNKEKFLLEPQKMGELVGGAIHGDVTGGGSNLRQKTSYSADAWVQRTGADACASGAITEEFYRFSGEADATSAQNWLTQAMQISYPCYN